MSLIKERQVAIQAVIKAVELCQQVRSQLTKTSSMTKQDKSPVTVADFGAQALVLNILEGVFPDDPIVAEEDATELLKQENYRFFRQI